MRPLGAVRCRLSTRSVQQVRPFRTGRPNLSCCSFLFSVQVLEPQALNVRGASLGFRAVQLQDPFQLKKRQCDVMRGGCSGQRPESCERISRESAISLRLFKPLRSARPKFGTLSYPFCFLTGTSLPESYANQHRLSKDTSSIPRHVSIL